MIKLNCWKFLSWLNFQLQIPMLIYSGSDWIYLLNFISSLSCKFCHFQGDSQICLGVFVTLFRLLLLSKEFMFIYLVNWIIILSPNGIILTRESNSMEWDNFIVQEITCGLGMTLKKAQNQTERERWRMYQIIKIKIFFSFEFQKLIFMFHGVFLTHLIHLYFCSNSKFDFRIIMISWGEHIIQRLWINNWQR